MFSFYGCSSFIDLLSHRWHESSDPPFCLFYFSCESVFCWVYRYTSQFFCLTSNFKLSFVKQKTITRWIPISCWKPMVFAILGLHHASDLDRFVAETDLQTESFKLKPQKPKLDPKIPSWSQDPPGPPHCRRTTGSCPATCTAPESPGVDETGSKMGSRMGTPFKRWMVTISWKLPWKNDGFRG